MKSLETRIPPPVWAISFGAAMWALAVFLPLMELLPHGWRWPGLVVGGIGFALDAWCISFFQRAKTTVNPLAPQKSTALVSGGPFSISRNPMYVGMLLWLTGWALFLGELSPFFLLPVFVIVLTQLQIIPEERALKKLFGPTYDAYCQRVPRWLGLPNKRS